MSWVRVDQTVDVRALFFIRHSNGQCVHCHAHDH
ncbi:hypothetical protein HNR17_002419 [Galbitalea soli]|nr:hypothetical protein [Galbitalea soli]